MKTTKYFSRQKCIKCKEILFGNEVCFNKGVCKYCGHQSHNKIICDTYYEVGRLICKNPKRWWKFWKLNKWEWESKQ